MSAIGFYVGKGGTCSLFPAEKLRAGDRKAVFPAGSFPPALKFVGG
jgi:hypothetical protein